MSLQRPHRITRGDHIPGGWLQRVAGAIVQRISIADRNVHRTGTSIAIGPSPRAGRGATVRQFRFKSMERDSQVIDSVTVEVDYLICRSWDGETEGSEDVKIAKPYLLRRTPFHDDGATGGTFSTFDTTKTRDDKGYIYDATNDFEREATKSDDATENQVIVPSYVVDDIIYAVRGVVGRLDANSIEVFNEGKPDEEARVVPLIWLHMDDGRAWAKVTD